MRYISLKNDSPLINNQRHEKLALIISMVVAILFFLGFPKLLIGQNKETIDFTVVDQKLSSALIMLANVADLNFSYNSDEEFFKNIISYSAKDKSPLIILDELLINTNHEFKVIGHQVVIFRSTGDIHKIPTQDNDRNQPPLAKDGATATIITKYVNRPVYDTIIITDTVIKFKTDTVFIIDTVLIEKEKPKKQPVNKIKDIPVDYFNKELSRESGWAGSIFAGPIISNFSLVSQENNFTIRNYSLGIELTKLHNSWNFTGGMKLTHFSEKFDHSYNVQEGGFFVTDTIDEYYTVNNNDTTYYYVTDSTWKPIDNKEYNYAVRNRVGMVELALSVSYDFYTNKNLRLYGKLGAQVGFMVYKNGIALPDTEVPEGVNFADLNFATQSVSGIAGVGMKYRIGDNIDFNPELYYLRYFNDIVKDYPTSTTITGLGIKIGLIYYF